MRWRVIALAMAVMVVGGSAVLLWTGKGNWQQCTDKRPEVRIAGCTAIITAGQDKPVNLAIATNNRGLAYAEREDYDRAIEDFDRVIKLDLNNATSARDALQNALHRRGNASRLKGDYERAIADADGLIERDPNDAAAFAIRGFSYHDKGDHARAIEDFDRVLALYPKAFDVLAGRAEALRRMGRLDLAIADADRAIELGPNFAASFATRGMAYQAKGDDDRAIQDFDRYLQLNRGNRDILARRNEAYRSKFKLASAPERPAPSETSELATRVVGCVVFAKPVGGIVAIRLPSLEQVVLREPRVGLPGLHALSGPDVEGRVTFIDNNGVDKRFSLKTISLRDRSQQEVFTREGDALWDHAIDGLSLAPRGGRVAFLVQPPESRRRFAPKIGIGLVETWDIAAKTGRESEFRAINWRLLWSPDGGRLIYRESRQGQQPDTGNAVLDVSSGKKEAWEPRFPVAIAPMAIAADGSTALLSMGTNGYAKFDMAAGSLTSVLLPSDFSGNWVQGPLWLIGDDLLLYVAKPPPAAPVKMTENNSPLVGPKPLMSLNLAELSTGRFQTIIAEFDTRTPVSFGATEACR